MSERTESPSRLSALLAKARIRDRKNRGSATNSVNSNSTEDDRAHGPVWTAMEAAIDKLKGQNGSEEDGDGDGSGSGSGSGSGIRKFVPKGLADRRSRKIQEREEEEEAVRGRSIADRGTLRDNSHSYANASTNSLITVDSDTESPFETQPPLSTHPSHIGYLTTSSPLVQASIVTEASLPNTQFDGTSSVSRSSHPDFAVAASHSTSSLATDKLQAPIDGSKKRSPSPVGRLKEVLTPRRGGSSNSSPERKANIEEPIIIQNSKDGKDSVGNSRRGSVVSRIFEKQGQQLESTNSSPERSRAGKLHSIDTSVRPQTPPSDSRGPIIVNTPPTPTDHSEARFPSPRDRARPDSSSNPNVVTSASGNMISHRRVRSGSTGLSGLGPSKLSNITSAPLTPTPENGATTPGQGGFFSSVFSAAQNAANTLSNSIANTSAAPSGNKNKGGTHELKDKTESPEVETMTDKSDSDTPLGEKELAVKTLGMGDLSLSALGIIEAVSAPNTPMAAKFPEEARGRSELANEDSFASRITLVPSSTIDTAEASAPNLDDIPPAPRSNYEPSAGERTPPNGSVFEGKAGVQRSGSIRSIVGHRRNRGSSAATGGSMSIGAAIVAAHGSLADPKAGQPKITGFAVASKKRNRDFHNLFRSVPEDDYLIEDYSCALQREILAHGRLYVSEGHLCFSSNIFGWVTTLVMSFDEIVSVEKRSTALLFKNGLMISTLHAKNIFASFTSRDSTYDLIVGIWKLGHPSLKSSLNGISIEETGGGDKTEKFDGNAVVGSQSGSESGSDDEEGDEVYDEDEDDEDGMSYTQADGSIAGSDVAEKVVSRKPSGGVAQNGIPAEKSKEESPATPGGDFPGPSTHAPTNCSDGDTHYAKILADEIIAAPVGKIFSLMFGPASVTWMKNWLTNEQRCLELTMEGTAALPLGPDNKVRNYSYIKPLSAPIGPKQTKCISTETLDTMDLEKAVSVTISTQTPDVPSGNVFSVKTRYCLTWAEGNATRLQVNCAIEWTGKSWLKGPIEKGANDGQVQYTKDIIAALKNAVSSRRGTVVAVSGKGKRKGRKGRESKSITQTTDGAADTKPVASDWGLFEPLHGIFGPIFDILGPLLTGNIMYGLLVGLLVASWFRFGFSGKRDRDTAMGFLGTPERIAAYEEIWRREESELWEWLEDRVGMDRVREVTKMPIEMKSTEERLKDEKMEQREIDAAIKVTEEKLQVLKEAIKKKKGGLVKIVQGEERKKEIPEEKVKEQIGLEPGS